jgi:hypothetical protein
MPDLDPEAVERAAKALQMYQTGEADPDELADWERPARIALEASGPIAERDEWKARALAAEARVLSVEPPGDWIEKMGRELDFHLLPDHIRNQLYAMEAERDQLTEQLKQARGIIERLFAIPELHGVEHGTKTSTLFADAVRFLADGASVSPSPDDTPTGEQCDRPN